MTTTRQIMTRTPHTPVSCFYCQRIQHGQVDPFFGCSGCMIACYCNDQCQRLDWFSHRHYCIGRLSTRPPMYDIGSTRKVIIMNVGPYDHEDKEITTDDKEIISDDMLEEERHSGSPREKLAGSHGVYTPKCYHVQCIGGNGRTSNGIGSSVGGLQIVNHGDSMVAKDYYQCSQCKDVLYCSFACQEADWSRHQIFCCTAESIQHHVQREVLFADIRMKRHESAFQVMKTNALLVSTFMNRLEYHREEGPGVLMIIPDYTRPSAAADKKLTYYTTWRSMSVFCTDVGLDAWGKRRLDHADPSTDMFFYVANQRHMSCLLIAKNAIGDWNKLTQDEQYDPERLAHLLSDTIHFTPLSSSVI